MLRPGSGRLHRVYQIIYAAIALPGVDAQSFHQDVFLLPADLHAQRRRPLELVVKGTHQGVDGLPAGNALVNRGAQGILVRPGPLLSRPRILFDRRVTGLYCHSPRQMLTRQIRH